MKVVKVTDFLEENETQVAEPNAGIDAVKVAEFQEKFDRTRQMMETKKYPVFLTAPQTVFLFDQFYKNVEWKGYESYAISETYQYLNNLVGTDGTLNGQLPTEITEAVFHFLKNYTARGFESAVLFRQICDQFALPMKEINEDRQILRDLSLELVAAEQGIEVETLVKNLEAQQRGQA
jgi:hypothetical protein